MTLFTLRAMQSFLCYGRGRVRKREQGEVVTHETCLLFEISHVCSDTLGRNSSESNVSLTALFINSFKVFHGACFSHSALNDTGLCHRERPSSPVCQAWGRSSSVLWTRPELSSLNLCLVYASAIVISHAMI